MALCFVLDENLRGALWHAVQQHNAAGADVLDCLCVGHPPAPLGTLDPDLLLWCESQGRVLVTADHRIGSHLQAHWGAGRHVPGVMIVKPGWTVPTVIAALVAFDQAYDPPEFVDRVEYVP